MSDIVVGFRIDEVMFSIDVVSKGTIIKVFWLFLSGFEVVLEMRFRRRGIRVVRKGRDASGFKFAIIGPHNRKIMGFSSDCFYVLIRIKTKRGKN